MTNEITNPKTPVTVVKDGLKYVTVKAFALNQALEALHDLTLIVNREDPTTRRFLEKGDEALKNLGWRQ